jgi:hypothetical protein
MPPPINDGHRAPAQIGGMFGLFGSKRRFTRPAFERQMAAILDRLEAGSHRGIKESLLPGWKRLVKQLYLLYAGEMDIDDPTPVADKCARWMIAHHEDRKVRDRLAQALAKVGTDLALLHPTVQRTLVREAILFGQAERTVEMFVKLVEAAQRQGRSDDERAAILLRVCTARLELMG